MEIQLNQNTNIPESIESYEQQSELNDMKQHADKIIQGIKKLEEIDANRAIWELFQNAVDLSSECETIIKLTEDTLQFSHNGQPFTPITLDCLFKQVSSKTLEEKKLEVEENEPVGQYGTGFITTHTFGKEIIIEGALIKGYGYIPLEQFVIDRQTDNWKVLAEHIRFLKREVAQLLSIDQIINLPYPLTKFTYKTVTNHNKECAHKAIKSLRLILPYVMTLNPRLKSVKVIEMDGSETLYRRNPMSKEGVMYVSLITINDKFQKVYFLRSDDDRIIVILPFTDNITASYFNEQLPRLFLYYPLIGTQDFGINYIIHSRYFQPTEPRNGLYLQSDNEENQKEEKANQALLKSATQMIFDFITNYSSSVINPVKLARIKYKTDSDKPHLNVFFKELKDLWVNEFKEFPLVETAKGKIKASESIFLDSSLLKNEEAFDSIYVLVSKFWNNIPVKHLVREWTEIIDDWKLEGIKYISFKELALKIQETSKLDSFENPKDLQTFYKFVIEQEQSVLFNNFKLLPNIKGDFRFLSELNNNISLPNVLIEIADQIMPDVPKRHIHSDFKFHFNLNSYSRKNYTTDFNEAISKLIKDDSISSLIQQESLFCLIKYCKITSTSDSSSVPSKLVKLICQYYRQDEKFIEIQSIKEDELDIRTPQKKLIRLFLNDISKQESNWVIENIDFLKQIIEIGSSYYDYEEMFRSLAVFPNQLNILTQQTFLQIDGNVPDKIKDMYDDVTKPKLPIRANLVHAEFVDFLINKEIKSVRSLTEIIESRFFEGSEQLSISNHPYKKEILQIIEDFKISPAYIKNFPLIFSNRSKILLELADGDDTFSILCLDPSKIKKLAELGKNSNLDEIIKLGQEAFSQKQHEKGNIQHKRTIGLHIEKVLRDYLKSTLSTLIIEVEVEEEQDGQDIIIKLNSEPLYFIEVKSRWDVNSSVRMSKNQTLRANEQRHNYALCSVDMTKYEGENKYNVSGIDEIRSLIMFNKDVGEKVVDLIPLLNQTNEPDTIYLEGDLRTVIPQKYIETGMELTDFESLLIQLLKDKNGITN